MANNPNLRVRISADLADIKQGLAVLRGDLNKLKSEAARSGPSTSSWVAGLKSARQQLVSFVATYASLRTLGSLAKVSDEAAGITGRLRLATKSQEDFNAAQYETFEIAQRTQASWKETVSLYSKVSQSADQVGLSQQKQLELTEAVSMALAISGSTGEEAAGVMRQFGQALGSARVQAEEFNSINEGGQRIVQSLAKHLGIASGQVKAYVNDGKVSNRDLAQALLKDQAALQGEYERMPKTIGGAFTQIRNSFVRFMNDQNEATGSAQAFVGILRDIARDLPQFFSPVLVVMQQLASNLRDAEDSADGLGRKASWLAGVGEFLANVFRVVAAAGIVVKNVVEVITVAITSLTSAAFSAAGGLADSLGGAFKNIANSWQALKDGGPLAAMQTYAAGVGGIMDGLTSRRRDMVAGFQAAGAMMRADVKDLTSGVSALFAEIEATTARVRGKQPPDAVEGGTAAAGKGGDKSGKAVAASNALLRDSVTRALAELDRIYGSNEVGLQEYFATRTKLQQQSIDLEIEQARLELLATKDKGQRQKLEEQIVMLQRDRADVGTKAAEEEKKANDDLAKTLSAVELQLMELDGKTGESERAKLMAEYDELFKRLDANSNSAGRKVVENLIGRLVSKAQAEELKAAGDRIAQALQGKESSISAQVAGGLLGYVEGERQLSEARNTAASEYRALRESALAYLATLDPASPEAANAQLLLQSLNADIANIAASQNQLRQDVGDSSVYALSNLFTSIREGALTASEMVRQLAVDFAQSLYDMQAKALAQKIGSSIAGMFGGGKAAGVDGGAAKLTAAAGATSLAGGVIQAGAVALSTSAASLLAAAQALMVANSVGGVAGVAHTGGVAGRISVKRTVSPLLFGHAPRYHSGGIAGLAPDEVPAILQTGERVLSRRQTAMYDATLAAGANAGRVTTPIVAIGDDAVANAMARAAGEDVVITHVRNNWEGLQRGG